MGVMHRVYASRLGCLWAQVLRLFGRPLPCYAEDDVPVTVAVYPDTSRSGKNGGLVWDRTYAFTRDPEHNIRSSKRLVSTTSIVGRKASEGLVEIAPSGLGIFLDLSEKDGGLCFSSRYNFWQLGRWRLPIPLWLTPGHTEAWQLPMDDDGCMGDDGFKYGLKITHPLWGVMFWQEGQFKAQDSA